MAEVAALAEADSTAAVEELVAVDSKVAAAVVDNMVEAGVADRKVMDLVGDVAEDSMAEVVDDFRLHFQELHSCRLRTVEFHLD